jgi:ribonuclease III
VLKTFSIFLRTFSPGKSGFQKQVFRLTGFTPLDSGLYRCALTHKSISGESASSTSFNNERLEYLGDAILSAVIADYLFSKYPECNEGFLTKMRSKIVSRQNLNNIALKMGFDKLVILPDKAVQVKKHIYGNALEAFIGAIFTDMGFSKAKQFIIGRILIPYFDLDQLECEDSDFKSQIIQWGQKNKKEVSFESYEMFADENTQPVFTATIHIMDSIAGKGMGSTKKEAQQHAARQALQNLPC